MNLPVMKSYEDKAIDTVVYVINKAKEHMGVHLTLKDLSNTRRKVSPEVKVSCQSLAPPYGVNGQTFIAEVIERNWRLCDTFLYVVNYVGFSRDNCTSYYYFEAIFSQPSEMYPIPQVTVSVFFRIECLHTEPVDTSLVPKIFYRIEGHHMEYDIRYVNLVADWLLAAMQMKLNIFEAIENLNLF